MNIRTLRCDFIGTNDSTRPLIVVLHGRGDSSAGFHFLPDALGYGQQVDYLLVNAPDPWWGGYSWYDLPPQQKSGIDRSIGLLDALFAEIFATGRDANKTLLLGFSQGCLMTLEWGARASHALAGYVGISGYCYDADKLGKELAPHTNRPVWLLTHGTHDDVLDYHTSAEQYARLRHAGLNLCFESYAKAHTIDPQDELPQIRAWVANCLKLATK